MQLTIIQAARYSGVHERIIRKMVKDGKLPSKIVHKSELPFVRGMPLYVNVVHEDDLRLLKEPAKN